ncbi:MAG: NAD(P)H-dependent oxidoreductase subunit E [Oscillospiraceae bacterium]|nr:NAD(P)H-dependent oxidoreductase subunit E [Oscillospiraceae bacterium]
MATKKCAVPFSGTEQQKTELLAVIDKFRAIPGALMPILQGAQGIYGYLPLEVQTMIAEEMNVPLAKIYGIVTFYSQFSLTPKGKYKISICLGTACYVKGAGEISRLFREKLGLESGGVTPDGKFSVEDCRCIGACGLAPVIMINDDVYGRLKGTGAEVDEILAKY